jgi:hypothetical protein
MEDKKEKEKSEKFAKAVNELTNRCADFIINNGTSGTYDIEFFITQLMLSFDLSFYEVLGILEEVKNSYREIMTGDENAD